VPLTNAIAGQAVGGDGAIYIATWDDPTMILGFTPQKQEMWRVVIPGHVGCFSAPAIGADGTVYVGCEDGEIHGIRP